jgi:protocatechuate 3,4-dioxygenase beta subunit
MKTLLSLLITTLATRTIRWPALAIVLALAVPVGAHGQQQWDAAQKLKPAHVTSVERIAPATEPGTPLTIHGLVLDPSGKPAAGVEVFAYHTDSNGIYAQTGASDPWRLKGWAVTDAQGRFEFHTIRPAPYPNRPIPAHVHVTVTAACCGRQFHELMFEGDPLATKAYRDQFAAAGEQGYYEKVARGSGGAEDVSYTVRLRAR